MELNKTSLFTKNKIKTKGAQQGFYKNILLYIIPSYFPLEAKLLYVYVCPLEMVWGQR